MRRLKTASLLFATLLCLDSALAAAPPGAAVTVRRGDCLWAIAARSSVYGDPWKWPLLYEANRDRIHDPDHIEPGWPLRAPVPTAADAARAVAYARAYGEDAPEVRDTEAVRVDEAPAVDLGPAAPAPPGGSKAWPLALIVLGLAAAAAVAHRRGLRRSGPPERLPELRRAPVAPAPVSTPAPPAPEPGTASLPAPAPEPWMESEPAEATAEAPKAAEAPQAADPAVPRTESESILRAERGPDPRPPDDHEHPQAA